MAKKKQKQQSKTKAKTKTKTKPRATAKTKVKAKQYDYRQLVAKPKVFGFFVGWYGQGLLNRVYESASGSISVESQGGWDSCVTEVHRLGAMVNAWSTDDDREPSPELVALLRGVTQLCGPEGYPGTPKGIKGTAFLQCDDVPPLRLPGCDVWPDVSDGDTVFDGEFGTLVQEIHSVVTMIGQLTFQQNVAAAGAQLCRIAFGDVSTDTNGEPYRWIESLVNLGLLPAPRRFKRVPMHEEDAVMLKHLKKMSGFEDEHDVMMNIPHIVCGHANLPCPPALSDVKKPPIFLTQKPAVVRADSLIRQERYGEAESILDSVLSWFKAHMNDRGKVYISVVNREELATIEQEHPDQTFVWLDDASYGKALHLKTFIAVVQRNLEEALRRSDTVVQFRPYSAAGHIERGGILNKLQQPAGALAAYQKALALAERFRSNINMRAAALRGIGFTHVELKDLPSARRAIEQSLKLEPDNRIAVQELNYIVDMEKE